MSHMAKELTNPTDRLPTVAALCKERIERYTEPAVDDEECRSSEIRQPSGAFGNTLEVIESSKITEDSALNLETNLPPPDEIQVDSNQLATYPLSLLTRSINWIVSSPALSVETFASSTARGFDVHQQNRNSQRRRGH